MVTTIKSMLILFLLFATATLFTPRLDAATSNKQEAQDKKKTDNSKRQKRLVYINKKYRFRFLLPTSWNGYSVIVGHWAGAAIEDQQEVPTKSLEGPLLTLRHALWTEKEPYQDIPIMIFTRVQWKYSEEHLVIFSAAPVGPREIGRNAKYVFALPARFNYADALGREEVDEMLQNKPLRPF